MSQSAYIRFVEGSAVPSLTLEELKDQLLKYKEQLVLTGKQLGWEYEEAGFPYSIETKPEAQGQWFYLKGKNSLYKYIVLGPGQSENDGTASHFVQVVLPADATHGDKSKANELCKHLGKTLKAELQLFNGRIMYFNPRK